MPGCLDGENDNSNTNYCILPGEAGDDGDDGGSSTTASMNNKDLKTSNSSPLGRCYGDCDYNENCHDGLFCWQRNSGDPVPGCNGSPNTDTDYCVREQDAPAKKLKMYWEDGYEWQDSPIEAFWCMECTECDKFTLGDGPPAGCVETPGREC